MRQTERGRKRVGFTLKRELNPSTKRISAQQPSQSRLIRTRSNRVHAPGRANQGRRYAALSS